MIIHKEAECIFSISSFCTSFYSPDGSNLSDGPAKMVLNISSPEQIELPLDTTVTLKVETPEAPSDTMSTTDRSPCGSFTNESMTRVRRMRGHIERVCRQV